MLHHYMNVVNFKLLTTTTQTVIYIKLRKSHRKAWVFNQEQNRFLFKLFVNSTARCHTIDTHSS